MIMAVLVKEWMFRGSTFDLVVRLYDGDGFYVIHPLAVGKLRIANSWSESESLLELEASDYIRESGTMTFSFAPEDTADFISGAYDLSIHIEADDGTDIIPGLQTRFGILAGANAEVAE